MKAPLRVALTLFSFEALQSWVIVAGGAMVVVGILVRQFELSAISAMLIVLRPGMFGGQELRLMSTPAVHLRPHGRLWMMMGAAATITLVALVFTLPVLVFQLSGLRIADGSSVFSLPAAATFRYCWGITALLWIWAFCTSNFPLLLGFTWVPWGAAILLIEALHIPSTQLANALFIIGATGWAAFSWWYMATDSITRPRQQPASIQGHSLMDLRRQLVRVWYGTSRVEPPWSRPQAFGQYLGGARPTLTPLMSGAAVTVIGAAGFHFVGGADVRTPMDYLMFLPISASFAAPALVARARLLWLRAGFDRARLFLAVERQALRAALAMLSVPVVVLVTMSLVHRPDLSLQIVLFAATQVVANVLFLQAGLTVTRGGNFESVLMFIVLGVLFLVMSIILQPGRGAFVWTYIATLGVFAALALLLRRHAARAWRELDWRVAGPLPAGIGRRKS